MQPTISAAFCLLEVDCERQEAYLKTDARVRGRRTPTASRCCAASSTRSAMLAVGGRDLGAHRAVRHGRGRAASRRVRRSRWVSASSRCGSRRSPSTCSTTRRTRSADAIELFRDAFDMLSEDFEEERFYVEIRQRVLVGAGRLGPSPSGRALIDNLEF